MDSEQVASQELPPLTPDEAIFPVEEKFLIGDKPVIVKPLVIRNYRGMAARLAVLVQLIMQQHPEINLNNLQEHVATLVIAGIDYIPGIFADIFYLDADWIDNNLDGEQATAIVARLLEVNRLPVIGKNLQRALQAAKQHKVN